MDRWTNMYTSSVVMIGGRYTGVQCKIISVLTHLNIFIIKFWEEYTMKKRITRYKRIN